MAPTALVLTFGCQMNVFDSSVLRQKLWELGFDEAQTEAAADLVILNTCSVRRKAEERIFGRLGRLKHIRDTKPTLRIGVVGCMAVASAEEIRRRAPYVSFIHPPEATDALAHDTHELFPDLIARPALGEADAGGPSPEDAAPLGGDFPFKKFLPIMRGCDNYCTYCIVPYVRGSERSLDPETVTTDVSKLVRAGVLEITLLGQNVNSYAAAGVRFPELLARLAAANASTRFRFLTSHPKDLSDELIQVMAKHPNICRHVHLPLQAGADEVLERMNRKYTARHYLERVRALRAAMPDIALTTDLISGFPGETAENFDATLKLVETIRFDAAFTFLYSPREGTRAASFDDPIPELERKARLMRLIELQKGISLAVNQRHVGRSELVLVEKPARRGGGLHVGRSGANKTVLFPCEPAWVGSFRRVRILKADAYTLFGDAGEPAGDIALHDEAASARN